MPLPAVRMLTVRCVVTAVRRAAVIRYRVQVVHAVRMTGRGGVRRQIQIAQRKVDDDVQLAAEPFRRRETLQVYHQDLRELLNRERLRALPPLFALRTGLERNETVTTFDAVFI